MGHDPIKPRPAPVARPGRIDKPMPVQVGHIDKGLDYYRGMFERTKNPLFVWQAIDMCKRLAPSAFGGTLPDWCLDYIAQSARRVCDLVANSYPTAPTRLLAPLTHIDATKGIPGALGFEGQGKKPFQEVQDLQLKAVLIDIYNCAVTVGIRGSAPMTREQALRIFVDPDADSAGRPQGRRPALRQPHPSALERKSGPDFRVAYSDVETAGKELRKAARKLGVKLAPATARVTAPQKPNIDRG